MYTSFLKRLRTNHILYALNSGIPKQRDLTCQGRSVRLKGFAHTKNVLNAEGAPN